MLYVGTNYPWGQSHERETKFQILTGDARRVTATGDGKGIFRA